jgi:hypothetical protein
MAEVNQSEKVICNMSNRHIGMALGRAVYERGKEI